MQFVEERLYTDVLSAEALALEGVKFPSTSIRANAKGGSPFVEGRVDHHRRVPKLAPMPARRSIVAGSAVVTKAAARNVGVLVALDVALATRPEQRPYSSQTRRTRSTLGASAVAGPPIFHGAAQAEVASDVTPAAASRIAFILSLIIGSFNKIARQPGGGSMFDTVEAGNRS